MGRKSKRVGKLPPQYKFFLNPYTDTCVLNGVAKPMAEYVGDTVVEGSTDQLLRCIETDAEPRDIVEVGRMGVEVLMAAYRSIEEGGKPIRLPLQEGDNPLTK